MCEFNVFKEGEKVAGEMVFAKVEGSGVTLRDTLGKERDMENACVTEVNVVSRRLILSGELSSSPLSQST